MNTEIINYSQCWEDPDIMLAALKINSDDKVLSITSGGDNTLVLLVAGPLKVVSVDMNIAQNYLLELKIAAARSLPYNEYLEFLGVTRSKQRLVLFEKVHSRLSDEAAVWWSAHVSLLKSGPIQCGRFERFINIFASYILPLVHSKKTVAKLLAFDDLEKQCIFVKQKWDSKAWRFFFGLITSRFILKRYARQRGMFRYTEKETVANIYRKRLEQHLVSVPTKRNYFLHYILTGEYGETLPPYLEENGYTQLRTISDSALHITTSSIFNYLQSMPDNTFSKFNLSDIFEALSSSENDALWEQIIRTAKPGAVVVYWNNLVERSYPAYLSPKIKTDDNFVNQLRLKDKVFFYNSFHAHTILK